jgi:hypothetical protein
MLHTTCFCLETATSSDEIILLFHLSIDLQSGLLHKILSPELFLVLLFFFCYILFTEEMYGVMVSKSEGMRLLGRRRCRWEDIKLGLYQGQENVMRVWFSDRMFYCDH